jgi:hypothetical protein
MVERLAVYWRVEECVFNFNWVRGFPPLHSFQIRLGANSAYCTVDIGDSYPVVKQLGREAHY